MGVDLLWPKQSCKLLGLSDDLILVDSPGIDVEANFDVWIEDYCQDADIFVLVVNSESTLMMREKLFFKKVTERIAKPNIMVLLNRWDLASEEEEYLIHAAQDQHIKRTCEFLINELKLTTDFQEAKEKIFFVSAREVSRNRLDPHKLSYLDLQRSSEWERFHEVITSNIDMNRGGLRLIKHIRSALEVASELRAFQSALMTNATSQLEAINDEYDATTRELEDLSFAMTSLTKELHLEIKILLNNIDAMVRQSFKDELENLPNVVYEFQATFIEDPAVINLYKQHLTRHIEATLKENLKSRLSREIATVLEDAQVSLLERITSLLPQKEKSDFLDLTPHRLPFELSFSHVDCSSLSKTFKEDVEFKFSLGPQNILSRTQMLKLRARNFVEQSKQPKQPEESNLVQTAGGIALESIGSSDADLTAIKLALSAAIIYSALYICERAIWTLTSAAEQQLKFQYVQHAVKHLEMMEDPLVDSIRQQVHRELTTLLGVACGSVESISVKLRTKKEKLSDNIETLQDATMNSDTLVQQTQDVDSRLQELLEKLE